MFNFKLPEMLKLVFPNKNNYSGYQLTTRSAQFFDIPAFNSSVDISEVQTVQFVSKNQENYSEVPTDQLSATSPYNVSSDTIQNNNSSPVRKNYFASATSQTDDLSPTSPYNVSSDTIQNNNSSPVRQNYFASPTSQNDITSVTSPYIPSTERTMQPVKNNNEFLMAKETTLLSPSFHVGGENEFDSIFNGGNHDEDRIDEITTPGSEQQRPSEIVRHFLGGDKEESSSDDDDGVDDVDDVDDDDGVYDDDGDKGDDFVDGDIDGGKRSDFTTSEVNRLNERLMSSDTITLTDNIRNAMKNIKHIDSEYDDIKRTRTPKRSHLTESDKYTNAKFKKNPKYH
jgi:hypothetical protein